MHINLSGLQNWPRLTKTVWSSFTGRMQIANITELGTLLTWEQINNLPHT